MTMDLIGNQGAISFTHQSWKLLIDLALKYGWKPAGAQEPDPEDTFVEDGEDDDDNFVELSEEQLEAFQVPSDHPLAQALNSLIVQTSDPVLGSYFNNAGFRVTAQDARALADALKSALPDIPSHNAMEHKSFQHPGAPGDLFVRLDTPVNVFEWFSGENKPHLKAFIAFCRKGGFKIQ